MTIDLFDNLVSSIPKEITLEEIIDRIRFDEDLKSITDRFREASASDDTAVAQKLKMISFPAFAPCALFMDGKSRDHLVSLTGLCLMDFDHVPWKEIEHVVGKLKADPHTFIISRSLSGRGFHVLSWYSIVPTDRFKKRVMNPQRMSLIYASAWKGVYDHYRSVTPETSIDTIASNAERLILLVSDPDVYYNPNATPFMFQYKHYSPRKLSRCPAFEECDPAVASKMVEPEWHFREGMSPYDTKVHILFSGKDRLTLMAANGSMCWVELLMPGETDLDQYSMSVSGEVLFFEKEFSVDTHKQMVAYVKNTYSEPDGLEKLAERVKGKEGFLVEDYRLDEESSDLDRDIVRLVLKESRSEYVSLKFCMDWYRDVTLILRQQGLSDEEILSLYRKEPIPLVWIKNHGGGITPNEVAELYHNKYVNH